MAMTPRQRVLQAVAHVQPDRVPIDFWAVPEVFAQLQSALDVADSEAVLRRFEVDLRYFDGPARRGQEHRVLPEGVVEDHWGVRRQVRTVSGQRRDGTTYTWTYKHLSSSPLAEGDSVADVERHPWPTPDLWDYSGVRAACRAIRQAGYAAVAGADRLDRTAQLKPAMYLRGVEQFMADLALAPAVAECILEHVGNYYLAYNRRVFQAAEGAIDIFFMGDDMGTQSSLWVSPDMYRRFFKRRLAAYCDLAHEFGAKVMYHTCGNVTALVGDFADAGVDILQSLQPAAMPEQLGWLKRQYGRVLSFQGGIDIQGVLPRGSPEDVRQHVRSRAEILAPGGGYIFGTAHSILPDTPTENILALVEAYHRFGKY
jgi:uroporphyrinogen decarboxylase